MWNFPSSHKGVFLVGGFFRYLDFFQQKHYIWCLCNMWLLNLSYNHDVLPTSKISEIRSFGNNYEQFNLIPLTQLPNLENWTSAIHFVIHRRIDKT